jgi:uncharacterized protein with HEPN domain
MWRDDAWVLDMLNAARRVVEYARDMDEPTFLAISRDQDAILRQLTILGEAAKGVSPEFRGAHPEIPWKRIAGFRDVVVHDYFHVDLREVWRIVQEDVPSLVGLLEPLVPPAAE